MTTQTDRPRADLELDTSGLLCPLPVYKAAMAMGQLASGQVLEIQAARLLVQQTHDNALAVTGGQRRDAHVDRAPGHSQGYAAVLRQSPLGNIEVGHDLEA